MARLTFPDQASAFVYEWNARNDKLGNASGRTVTIYADAGHTTLADIRTLDGDPITGSQLTVGDDSTLPAFLGPDNGTGILYDQFGAQILAVEADAAAGLAARVAAIEANAWVTTPRLGDGQVTAAKVAPDVATQAELDAEASTRAAADTANASAITSEATTARAAETANASAITSEAATARAAEAANATAITNEAATARAAEALKVAKAGDTMAGPLVLAGNPNAALQAAPKQYVDAVAGVVSALDPQFGVTGDAVLLTDATISAGTLGTVSSPSAAWTPAHVGKTISVQGAAGAPVAGRPLSGLTLKTTIASVIDATHCTLTVPATVAVANTRCVYGSDDTTGLQAWLAACAGKHGVLPPAPGGSGYLITGSLYAYSGSTLSCFGGRLIGTNPSADTRWFNGGGLTAPTVSVDRLRVFGLRITTLEPATRGHVGIAGMTGSDGTFVAYCEIKGCGQYALLLAGDFAVGHAGGGAFGGGSNEQAVFNTLDMRGTNSNYGGAGLPLASTACGFSYPFGGTGFLTRPGARWLNNTMYLGDFTVDGLKFQNQLGGGGEGNVYIGGVAKNFEASVNPVNCRGVSFHKETVIGSRAAFGVSDAPGVDSGLINQSITYSGCYAEIDGGPGSTSAFGFYGALGGYDGLTIGPDNEVKPCPVVGATLTIVGATGGTFTLTLGTQTTGAITYVAGNDTQTATNIQAALAALTNVGSVLDGGSNALVSVTSAGVFSITFSPWVNRDLTISVTSSLTGGGTAAATPVAGRARLAVFMRPQSLGTLVAAASDGAALPQGTINVASTAGALPSGKLKLLVSGVSTTVAAGGDGLVLPTNTIPVVSTAGFASSFGSFVVNTDLGPQTVSYTGISGGTFIGCSGGVGTLTAGATVQSTASSGTVTYTGITATSFTGCSGGSGTLHTGQTVLFPGANTVPWTNFKEFRNRWNGVGVQVIGDQTGTVQGCPKGSFAGSTMRGQTVGSVGYSLVGDDIEATSLIVDKMAGTGLLIAGQRPKIKNVGVFDANVSARVTDCTVAADGVTITTTDPKGFYTQVGQTIITGTGIPGATTFSWLSPTTGLLSNASTPGAIGTVVFTTALAGISWYGDDAEIEGNKVHNLTAEGMCDWAFSPISTTTFNRVDSATLTSGSSVIADASITAADQGQPVTSQYGQGIPRGSVVGAVTPGVSFVLVNAAGTADLATSDGAVSLTIGPSASRWRYRDNPEPLGMRLGRINPQGAIPEGAPRSQGALQSFASKAVTGTTAETTLAQRNIPRGAVGPFGGFRIRLAGTMTGTAGTKGLKLIFDTVNVFSLTIAAATTTWQADIEIINLGVAGAQQVARFRKLEGSALNAASVLSTFVNLQSAARVFKLTTTPASAADTVTLLLFEVEELVG